MGDLLMKTLGWTALLLVVVGNVNWGVVGLAQFELVAALFGGAASPIARAAYTLFGVAGVALLAMRSRHSLAHQHA
jgi:uncharacterized membrane protein YuzA (DUF378 family)